MLYLPATVMDFLPVLLIYSAHTFENDIYQRFHEQAKDWLPWKAS